MGRPGVDGQDFGSLVRRYRLLAGLTQLDLAHATGVSVRTVRNLELGAVAPQRRTAELLVDGLGIDAAVRAQLLATVIDDPVAGDQNDSAPQPIGTGRRVVARPADRPGAMPPDLPDFVGREVELARLSGLVGTAGVGPDGTVVVVNGLPGVGKTALLVRAAYQLAGRFGGRALYLGLGGGDGERVPPEQALADLLLALDVPPGQLPATAGERVTLYRMLTAHQGGLLVLDNADPDHVRPLLPAGPWLTMVSSRNALAGLTGVHRLPLDVLPDGDAHRLLQHVAGRNRVRGDAAGELIALCGRLPLALRLAAGQLADHPEWTVRGLVSQLRDERARLDLLRDGSTEVRSALGASYRRLGEAERALLRRTALLPGTNIAADVAAVLLESADPEAADVLDTLADAGLLTPAARPGGYVLHDLVRLFALERAEEEEPPGDRDDVLDRVEAWLLAGVSEAARWFEPHPDRTGDGGAGAPVWPLGLGSIDEAMTWLVAERAGWWWAIQRAAAAGRHGSVIRAARDLHWYSDRQPRTTPWFQLFGLAVVAARALGDQREEAIQRGARGWAAGAELGRYADALAELKPARTYFEVTGDRTNLAWMVWYTSLMSLRLQRYDDAADHARRAAGLFAEIGDQQAVLMAYSGLGGVEAARGDNRAAAAWLQRVIDELDPATDDNRDLNALAHANRKLATVHSAEGRPAEAIAAARLARDQAVRATSQIATLDSLIILGTVLAPVDPAEAGAVLREAVTLAQAIHHLTMEAEARFRLGQVLTDAEQDAQWRRAASICDGLGTPEAAELRARIPIAAASG